MKHLKTILGAVVLLMAFACTKNQAEGNGQVSFVLTGDYQIADQTRSNVSQYTTLPSSEDFTITITDASSAPVWAGKLSDWDSATLLKAGNYKVTATYGDIEDEGFDKPFFTGAADFTVAGAQTAEVTVNVSLGNTIIMIGCTDNFRNYYKDYTFRLTRNGSEIVTFVKDEAKAAFVDAYKFTLEGTVVSETRTQTFSKDYASLKEATAYTIMFDASNVGSNSITITFNNAVETVELGDMELND